MTPLTASVLSLNVLSQHNLDNSLANRANDARYTHVPAGESSWGARFPKLKRFLRLLVDHTRADVIAMQEVDFAVMYEEENGLKRFMEEELGFASVHQWSKAVEEARAKATRKPRGKKGENEKTQANSITNNNNVTPLVEEIKPPHPWGVATFYSRAKWELVFQESRSRSLVVGLSPRSAPSESEGSVTPTATAKDDQRKTDEALYVLNMHLEANSEKTTERLAQLHSTLWKLSVHAAINPATARVVVLGDFNSTRDDPPMRYLLQNNNGSMTRRKEEEEESKARVQDEREHGPEENDKDDSPHAFYFANAYADAKYDAVATYRDPFAAARVDQLVYTCDTVSLASLLEKSFVEGDDPKKPVYSSTFPTDHLPIGGVFTLLPIDPALRGARGEESASALAEKENGGLTPGQLRVLEFLESTLPIRAKEDKRRKQKPGKAEMEMIKTHQQSLAAFSRHLTPAQKTWVKNWRKEYHKREGLKRAAAVEVSDAMLMQHQKRSQSMKILPSEMSVWGPASHEDAIARLFGDEDSFSGSHASSASPQPLGLKQNSSSSSASSSPSPSPPIPTLNNGGGDTVVAPPATRQRHKSMVVKFLSTNY